MAFAPFPLQSIKCQTNFSKHGSEANLWTDSSRSTCSTDKKNQEKPKFKSSAYTKHFEHFFGRRSVFIPMNINYHNNFDATGGLTVFIPIFFPSNVALVFSSWFNCVSKPRNRTASKIDLTLVARPDAHTHANGLLFSRRNNWAVVTIQAIMITQRDTRTRSNQSWGPRSLEKIFEAWNFFRNLLSHADFFSN